jgi:hypothetical protein
MQHTVDVFVWLRIVYVHMYIKVGIAAAIVTQSRVDICWVQSLLAQGVPIAAVNRLSDA